MISMFLSAIAHCTGWPPNVIPCVYVASPSRNGSITRSAAITAPIDAYADERPFADVIDVGLDVVALEPNHSPRRPKPVITSSAQSRMPYGRRSRARPASSPRAA